MIKKGDLVGWANYKSKPTPEELDDFGIVVSIHTEKQHFGFPEMSKIRIAWRRDPDSPIDEYPLSWATGETKTGALVILSFAGDI